MRTRYMSSWLCLSAYIAAILLNMRTVDAAALPVPLYLTPVAKAEGSGTTLTITNADRDLCDGVTYEIGNTKFFTVICYEFGTISTKLNDRYRATTYPEYRSRSANAWNQPISITNAGTETRCTNRGNALCNRHLSFTNECRTGTLGIDATVEHDSRGWGQMSEADAKSWAMQVKVSVWGGTGNPMMSGYVVKSEASFIDTSYGTNIAPPSVVILLGDTVPATAPVYATVAAAKITLDYDAVSGLTAYRLWHDSQGGWTVGQDVKDVIYMANWANNLDVAANLFPSDFGVCDALPLRSPVALREVADYLTNGLIPMVLFFRTETIHVNCDVNGNTRSGDRLLWEASDGRSLCSRPRMTTLPRVALTFESATMLNRMVSSVGVEHYWSGFRCYASATDTATTNCREPNGFIIGRYVGFESGAVRTACYDAYPFRVGDAADGVDIPPELLGALYGIWGGCEFALNVYWSLLPVVTETTERRVGTWSDTEIMSLRTGRGLENFATSMSRFAALLFWYQELVLSTCSGPSNIQSPVAAPPTFKDADFNAFFGAMQAAAEGSRRFLTRCASTLTIASATSHWPDNVMSCVTTLTAGVTTNVQFPHFVLPDNLNPAQKISADGSIAVCPVGIDPRGCIAPDSDGCHFGRDKNGDWKSLEVKPSQGNRLFDVFDPQVYAAEISPRSATIPPSAIKWNGLKADDAFVQFTLTQPVSSSSVTVIETPVVCPSDLSAVTAYGMIGSPVGVEVGFTLNFSLPSGTPPRLASLDQTVTGGVTLLRKYIKGVNGRYSSSVLVLGESSNTITVDVRFIDPNGQRCTGVGGTFTLPVKTFISDPPIITTEHDNVLTEEDCILGVCSLSLPGWPFGTGGLVAAVVLVILVCIGGCVAIYFATKMKLPVASSKDAVSAVKMYD